MATETVPAMLTDEQVRQIALDAGCSPVFDDGALVYQLCRGVEQAVLQSPEVRAWKRDAEAFRLMVSFRLTVKVDEVCSKDIKVGGADLPKWQGNTDRYVRHPGGSKRRIRS